MLRLAEVRVDASLFVRLQFFVVVFLTLTSASSHATDEGLRESDYATAQIQLIPKNSPTPISLRVKLAVNPLQHAYGLMFSPPLPAKSGMLFIFEDTKPRSFWMKNTPIALDILFFDADGVLVTSIRRAEPNSLELLHSKGDAKYVLEIGGGEAARLGFILGTRLQLPIGVPVNRAKKQNK